MVVPRSDLENRGCDGGKARKGGEASASIIVDLGETRTRRRREGMNRRENWRGGGGGERKTKREGEETSRGE